MLVVTITLIVGLFFPRWTPGLEFLEGNSRASEIPPTWGVATWLTTPSQKSAGLRFVRGEAAMRRPRCRAPGDPEVLFIPSAAPTRTRIACLSWHFISFFIYIYTSVLFLCIFFKVNKRATMFFFFRVCFVMSKYRNTFLSWISLLCVVFRRNTQSSRLMQTFWRGCMITINILPEITGKCIFKKLHE